MSKKSESVEQHIKSVKRRTRRKYSAEEKIRIVLEGMRGEHSIAELCRREGIAQSQYYSWSKDFMEAGKKRLAGDTQREARSDEVVEMRREMRDLKEVVADLTLENRVLKKSVLADGDDNT
jgi:transposase